jgi:alginate O-acetyltransferase complex protein AlgI
MLFSTYTFVAFMACVLLAAAVVRSWAARKAVLLLASYAFYASWNWPFTVLLILSTVVDFTVARRMAVTEARGPRRALLLLSCVVNLGILGVFKYANFLADSVEAVLGIAGSTAVLPHFEIILPLGISFYTFQTLSYSIDVYRGKYAPTDRILDFALFVTFFPQLVAGPIVRADHFLPQCLEPPPPDPSRWSTGAVLFIWGLFKKVAIADNIGVVVDQVYAMPDQVGALGALVGTCAFAVQIYCDFSGYSHMAIGMALWLGFHLPDNFLHPYAAIGFSDFWRRWHISLSQWLRDYLYISLGGNRGGERRTARNLMLTMLLGGLWHGAAWNFVIWGGLHGAYLWGERIILERLGISRHGQRPGGVRGFALAMLTFSLVLVTWVFFRAQTFDDAMMILGRMGLSGGVRGPMDPGLEATALTMGTLAVLLVGGWIGRATRIETVAARLDPRMRVAGLGCILAVTYVMGGPSRAFIYFQF